METFLIALKLGQSILDKTPNYPESKRSKYHKLIREYNSEITKRYPERDDDLIMNLREDAKIMWQEIISHLGES